MDYRENLSRALSDRYTIDREVGSGGMATVFLAEDLKHQRKVAIKVLRPELSSSVGGERFLREIQIAANLSHPHILPLHDSGEVEGQLFYVMPFVEGESLRDRLKREHQLPIEDALRITGQVAAALGHAHKQGIVHRDIKPENILLSGGEAVVADFGIAGAVEIAGGERLTATGMAIGTPAYMSPEQAGGRSDIDPRSDIYSLGCVLYEMLLGDPPFMGSTAEAILARKLTEPVQKLRSVRETIPPGVEQVAMKALARIPVDRFETADEFVVELERAPTLVVDEVPGRDLVVRLRRTPAVVAAVVLFAVVGWWATTRGGGVLPSPSLAVLLPPAVLDDPAREEFVMKIHEAVDFELTKLGFLVTAREAMQRMRGGERPLGQIAEELSVAEFVGLSVSEEGDDTEVNVRLINGETEAQLWAESYRGGVNELPTLISGIAGGIAVAIQGVLTPEQEARLALVRDVDPRAYDAYLTGTVLLRTMTPESFAAAEHYFLQALEIDPDFAPAVAWLSFVYASQGNFGYALATDVFPRARELAERAIGLDSTVAESHAALAMVHRYDRAWTEEGGKWERAIALDSLKPGPRAGYAYWLQMMGRFDEAIGEYQKAVDIEPLHVQYNKELARMYHFARRFDEAIEQFGRALRLDPTNWGTHLQLSWTYAQTERLDSAVAAAERAVELLPNHPAPAVFLARTYAQIGREAEAREILGGVEQGDIQPQAAALAIAYGALEEYDRAFSYLDTAYENHDSWLFQLNDALFDPLREDDRFDDLLRRLGLPVDNGGN